VTISARSVLSGQQASASIRPAINRATPPRQVGQVRAREARFSWPESHFTRTLKYRAVGHHFSLDFRPAVIVGKWPSGPSRSRVERGQPGRPNMTSSFTPAVRSEIGGTRHGPLSCRH
jgi:hypothetical protein